MAGCAALILLGAGGATASRTGSLFPAPDWPLPTNGSFIVILCDDYTEDCEGTATARQRRAVEERLRGRPEVVDVKFRSRRDAYEDMVAASADNAELVAMLRVEDLPESFVGRVGSIDQATDFNAVLGGMPGVSSAETFGVPHPPGMVDVAIILCTDTAPRCEGSGGVTEDRRRAIETRIAAMPGLARIHYADENYTFRVSRHVWARGTGSTNPGVRMYLVKLGKGQTLGQIRAALGGMPGVMSIDAQNPTP
jgi:cell division protein FtsX